MNDRELADRFLKQLTEGIIAWRYPTNVMPEFKPTFGKFFTGEPLAEAVRYDQIDEIIAATGAKITHHWRCKKPRCNRPPLDRILLPPRSRFIDDRQYHAVRIHEVIHFLEHPWRASWFGPADQGELIAECGTGFVESFLRLPHDTDNTNIQKWLPKWTEGIEADTAYLFNAVAQAERSVNYLLDLRRRREAAQAEHLAGRKFMAKKADQKNDDGKNGGSKRLTKEEYDRLVQGVDDIFFGGLDEPMAEEESPHEKPASETPKSGDEAG